MTEGNGAGRVLLVEPSPDEEAALGALTGVRTVAADDLATAAAGDDVTVVVVGSAAPSPVAVVQHAHRAAPGAGVAVVTTADSVDAVRRQLSYAPGVPLEVVVVAPGEPLAERVQALRTVSAGRRRHLALLAGIAARSSATQAQPRSEVVHLRALLEHAPLGIVVCDPSGRVLGWNRAAEALLRLVPASTGAPVDRVLPGAGELVDALAGGDDGVPAPVELVTGRVELEVSAVTSELDDGRPVALLLLVDVTLRREAERSRDRLAGHVELLAQASEVLTRTLDPAQAVELLARVLVPSLADWVGIRLGDQPSGLRIVTVHHRDAALAGTAVAARRAIAAQPYGPMARRVTGGETVLLHALAPDELEREMGSRDVTDAVAALGAASMLAVPLRGRTSVLGLLVLATGDPTRSFSDTDVAVAQEIGRRAGIALDNARLYAEQREVATELQRSLLTEPPQPPGLQIAVRYVAAAQQSQVGGDWYDAFLQPDGATVLVIGDVVGHDTRAAAAMGQLRGLVRGIAYTTNDEPAEILTRVDTAIEGLLLGTTATAVVARIEPAPGGDGGMRVTWSNAGHPPPILMCPDGPIDVLADDPGLDDADLLLGIEPATPRRTSHATLPAGSTLLLYTDGLVERRGQSLDEGVSALIALLGEAGELSLEELCDTALRGLVPSEPEDDVALVAVRLRA